MMGRCACTKRHCKSSFPVSTSDVISHPVLIVTPLTMLETQVGFDVGTLLDVCSGAESEAGAPVAWYSWFAKEAAHVELVAKAAATGARLIYPL